MKKNLWLLIGLTLSTSLLAQQLTNPPPAAPLQGAAPSDTNAVQPTAATPVSAEAKPAASAASTNAEPKAPAASKPAKKSGKKASAKSAKKKAPAARLSTNPLVPGPAMVVASNVNVRAQAKLNSEVVTRVNKGQDLIVLEEIVRNNSADNEPSAWAKIVLPPGTKVWVHNSYVSNNVVVPRLLNVRSGPGENYSVVGTIPKGTTLAPLATKDTWMQIEAPSNAYGFIAAQYLTQETPPSIVEVPLPDKTAAPVTEPAPTVPETPTTPEKVAEAPVVAPAPTDTPMPPATASTTPAEPATPQATAPAMEAPAAELATTDTNTIPEEVMEEPLPKRIVQREGIVRGTTSIQAPTHFALVSPETGRLIDYLYSSSPSLDLRRYKGLRVIVTGEEALEERWGNTPVITIETLDLLEE